MTDCKQSISHTLSCVHKQGNINSLKTYDRPAVLRLINDKGDTLHVTITSINDDVSTVYPNNTAYTIKLRELDR